MPGIHLYRSNRVEVLGAALAAMLRAAPPEDPLAVVSVGVSNLGIAEWLREELARALGVCAQISFPFATHWLASLPGGPRWEMRRARLRLVEHFPTLRARPGLEHLGAWVPSGGPVTRAEMRFAREMADILDRYEHWRPEWVRAWSSGEVSTDFADAAWQVELWRVAREPAEDLEELPSTGDRLRFFAVSHWTRAALAQLAALSTTRDVDIFVLTPSREYLVPRADGGHRLLGALGKVSREQQSLLEDLAEGGRGYDWFPPVEGMDALHRLQREILEDVEGPRAPVDDGDDSIQVHGASSPTRQVEVLRDVLYGLLGRSPALRVEDVLILTPELEVYAPLVRAVFGVGVAQSEALQVRVLEVSAAGESPEVVALRQWLGLAGGRLPASEVIAWLELPVVRARAGIAEREIGAVRGWIAEAGIRWGEDGEHRDREGLPPTDLASWRQGAVRLAMGVAMAEGERLPENGVPPVDRAEGDGLTVVGKLLRWIRVFLEEVAEARVPASLSEWATRLQRTVSRLIDTRGARSGQLLVEQLRALQEDAEQMQITRQFTLDAVREELSLRWNSREGHTGGQGVRLASLGGWSGVPSPVIALLGLDEAAFPRAAARPRADYTQRFPARGDQDPRAEDHFLLLQSILAARERWIAVYAARDPQSGDFRPPPSPLSEVQRYLEAAWDGALAGGSQIHPLQESLSQGDGTMTPFVGSPLAGQRGRHVLALESIQRYFRHPSRDWVRHRLGVDWGPREGELQDRETLAVEGRERWSVEERLTRAAWAGRDLDALAERLMARGELGPPGFAEAQLHQFRARVDHLAACWPKERDTVLDEVEWRAPWGIMRGLVPRIQRGYLLWTTAGREEAGLVMEVWTGLLLRAARGEPVAGAKLWLNSEGARVQRVLFEVPPDPAVELGRLWALRERGWLAPIPLFPRSSWAYAVVCQGAPGGLTEDSAVAALELARALWDGDGQRPGERHDPYHRRLWGEGNPWDHVATAALAEEIWSPLLACRVVEWEDAGREP